MKPVKVVIKKYANRRLYDTSGSRYVNLEDIATLIRNGTEVQVVDAKTGSDLTRVTLTQVILEDAKDEPTGLPLELLRQLIVASDNVRQEFMRSAVDTYSRLQDAFQSGLTEVRSAALSPLETMSRVMQGATAAPKPATHGPAKAREGNELKQLRRRVAELETLARKTRRPSKRRKA